VRHARVTESDQDNVGGDQPQRPWTEAAVPGHEPVLAHGPLQPRQPGDHGDHDQDQIGADEPGEPSTGQEKPTRGSECAATFSRHEQRQCDPEAQTGQA